MIDFVQFDKKLEKDNSFQKKIAQKLFLKINKRTPITKNFAELLRYCISRDVGLMFAPLRASKTKKHVFKETTLYKVIRATLRKAFWKPGEDIPDQDIIDALSSALHNCKDWDGGRTARSKKTVQADTEVQHHGY
ncbi:uncharacterized protein LOC108736206 [Agrilus planipennis]|uniref:Uncharacterized protein LOC108736206 n=1 Tax=Agrilus planipennis TaxID=224129 RepID=A0A7F5RJT4_AGRPL|nr:uncharacterized protein LOC108736206 [Agrilus planipennis]